MQKLRQMIADSYSWRRFGRLELRLSDTITVPFSTRSLRRRYVVVPSAMLANDGDLRIALAHELQHLRQHDVEWEIALEVLRPFLFWNPAFHLWKARVERLRELSCDRRVMARRGYDVAAYCQCLLRVCHQSLRKPRLFAVEAPVVALVRAENRLFAERSAELLRGRLVSLIEGKAERHPNAVFALAALPLLALTLMASIAIQKPGDWSEDRIMLSTIINLERIHATNGTASFGSPGY
jgi:beta-lactamase regulating signal transducer with metallopeptidase domain